MEASRLGRWQQVDHDAVHELLMHLWPVILAGSVFLIFERLFSLEDEKVKGEGSGQVCGPSLCNDLPC